MKINRELCIGCGACIIQCIMNAISMEENIAQIDTRECVECGECKRGNYCPTGAIYQDELQWPRILRQQFSNPSVPHADGSYGRGTEEMKTNDVTDKYKKGQIGLMLDIGRPGIGVRFSEVEKISMMLARYGAILEKRNPLYNLLDNPMTGKFAKGVIEEKVLSCIIEIIETPEKIAKILHGLRKLAPRLNTVISIGIVVRTEEDGSMPEYEYLVGKGFESVGHAKVNIGLGKISDVKGV